MDEDAPGTEPLAWEVVAEELPEDLKALWERALQGTKKLDVKRFLQDVPLFRQLPQRPPENN